MKPNIAVPIQEVTRGNSGGYAFVVLDFNNVYHYFNWDGTYDGYSADPHIDGSCGLCLN